MDKEIFEPNEIEFFTGHTKHFSSDQTRHGAKMVTNLPTRDTIVKHATGQESQSFEF